MHIKGSQPKKRSLHLLIKQQKQQQQQHQKIKKNIKMETANKIVYNVAILLVPYSYLSIFLFVPATVGPLLFCIWQQPNERTTQKKHNKLCPELTWQRSPEQTGSTPRREQWKTFESPFTFSPFGITA